MLLAGLILWLNLTYIEEVWTAGSESSMVTPGYVAQLIWERRNDIDWAKDGYFCRKRYYGWPFKLCSEQAFARFNSGLWEAYDYWPDLNWYQDGTDRWNLAYNLACWCLMFIFATFGARKLERHVVEKRFRLRTSTIAIAVLIAGFLVWKNQPHREVFKGVNFLENEKQYDRNEYLATMQQMEWRRDAPFVREEYAGWPFETWVRQELVRYKNGTFTNIAVAGFSTTGWIKNGFPYSLDYDQRFLPFITYNVCAWLFMILAPCCLWEAILRLRPKR